MQEPQKPTFDVLFAGGGLASGLCALWMAEARPQARIGIVEAAPTLGGNHTWSFHETDVPGEAERVLAPLIAFRWDGQKVAFPARARQLSIGYRTITAERFHQALSEHPSIEVITGAAIAATSEATIRLERGDTLAAPLIFDGRGPIATPHLTLGFQKFLGQHVRLLHPHKETAPTIMDATVPQTDGYRFVYTLPFTEREILIEDTYYADGHDLPRQSLRDEITRYAAAKGWQIEGVVREEEGILPIVIDGNMDAYLKEAFRVSGGAAPIGLRAGLFHPVTGYSVPEAVKVAMALAKAPPATSEAACARMRAHVLGRWREHGFYRLLNRMLFRAASPEERYIVLERFYGLPESLIARFYAGDTSMGDKVRILAGRPPVPLGRAIRALPAAHRGQPVQEGLLG